MLSKIQNNCSSELRAFIDTEENLYAITAVLA